MTDEEFEELKRVCRVRGVPEPTEKPAPIKWYVVSAEAIQEFLKGRDVDRTPGEGLPCPPSEMGEGNIGYASFSKSYIIKDFRKA